MANNIELLRQALSASESSMKLAKQILNDIERGATVPEKQMKKVLPGVMGTFDGENMVTESGEKYPVPANYASKSMLVVGDTLKLVDEKGGKKFKQIEHVKRYKTEGVLTKKDGKFHVVATEGSYRVLPAAVDYFKASVEDKINIWIPAKNQIVSWAAIESVVGAEQAKVESTKSEAEKPKEQERKLEIQQEAVKTQNPKQKEKYQVSEKKPQTTETKKQIVKKEAKPVPKVMSSPQIENSNDQPEKTAGKAPPVKKTEPADDVGEEELR